MTSKLFTLTLEYLKASVKLRKMTNRSPHPRVNHRHGGQVGVSSCQYEQTEVGGYHFNLCRDVIN